jgi:putative nucleotidyltransferase with HDIG domain
VLIRPSQDVTDLVGAMEAKHPLVASHCRRVAAYGVLLATHYGLPESTVDAIRIGGLLHDIGKMMVPDHILAKPGRLTEDQWRALQAHPEHGFDMVEPLGFDSDVLDIVLYHHERADRSGYPDGLDLTAIPWGVRIVSVMDAFDALTSPRTYRAALSIDAARTLLARESADRYCPWVVSGLLSIPTPMLEAVANGVPDFFRPDARPSEAVLRAATTPWTPSHVEDPRLFSAW